VSQDFSEIPSKGRNGKREVSQDFSEIPHTVYCGLRIIYDITDTYLKNQVSTSCIFYRLLQQHTTFRRPKFLRYPIGITTQIGESEPMDLPFLFSKNRIFRA
jgi:hypothetical protein